MTIGMRALTALPVILAMLRSSVADEPARSPDQELPQHITRLTLFGERADFSQRLAQTRPAGELA